MNFLLNVFLKCSSKTNVMVKTDDLWSERGETVTLLNVN